jgi:hypothetical protein
VFIRVGLIPDASNLKDLCSGGGSRAQEGDMRWVRDNTVFRREMPLVRSHASPVR